MKERHNSATTLLAALIEESKAEKHPGTGACLLENEALSRARLIEGDFVDLWGEVKDSNVMYLNNYGRWFKFVS